MRLSNIIFKSLGEKKKGISFPLPNHLKLGESKWTEEKVISYETGGKSDKESPLTPSTPSTTTNPYTATQLCLSAASLCPASFTMLQVTRDGDLNIKQGRQLILIVEQRDCQRSLLHAAVMCPL